MNPNTNSSIFYIVKKTRTFIIGDNDKNFSFFSVHRYRYLVSSSISMQVVPGIGTSKFMPMLNAQSRGFRIHTHTQTHTHTHILCTYYSFLRVEMGDSDSFLRKEQSYQRRQRFIFTEQLAQVATAFFPSAHFISKL